MARLEIDDRAFSDPRLKRLARILGADQMTAIGILVTLWHDSQEQLKAAATRDEIKAWLHLTPKRGERMISALIEAAYIVPIEGEFLKICGNERRLSVIAAKRKNARNSATARWNKYANKLENRKYEDAGRNADASQLFNRAALQSQCLEEEKGRRREEEKGRGKEVSVLRTGRRAADAPALALDIAASSCEAPADHAAAPKRPSRTKAEPAGTSALIAHFVEAYPSRYGEKPVIDGPAAGAAKRIVKAVGLGESRRLVDGFLRMDDGWFVTKRHTLQVLADNMNAVKQFLATGVQVTATAIRQAERATHNRSVAKEYLRMREEIETATATPAPMGAANDW